MSRRDINSFGPFLENVIFRNTRFDPNQTRFERLASKMAAAFGYSAELPGDPRLLQLLRLRVAQLNPCSYCLILHTEVATKIGISQVVVAHLPSWRESTMFSVKERASLEYCEALTVFNQERFAAAHDKLRAHFTERDVAEIADRRRDEIQRGPQRPGGNPVLPDHEDPPCAVVLHPKHSV